MGGLGGAGGGGGGGGGEVGLPALDVALAFPQATPASLFPPAVSDYYQLDDLLTNEEKVLRKKVQGVMEKEIAPIMTEYWEKAEFPFHVIPKLATLGLAGGTTKGYGCPGLSLTATAISTAEVARVDASCSTFILAHASLVVPTIALCGSESQKQQYLPSLAQFKMLGCWALTEPDNGSDASSLRTAATKVPGGWHLNGQKRWIGNSTFADMLIILARNAETKQLNGFIVKKGAPGLKATKIENKIGLRMVQNGDIVLDKVFVPEEERIPGINSFQDIKKVFAMSRVLVTWQPIGISMGVFDMCHRYLKERKQFGAPLAAFQLNQEKLVRMLGNVQAMLLVGWRLCKLYEAGKLTPGQSSLGKAWTSRKAREARDRIESLEVSCVWKEVEQPESVANGTTGCDHEDDDLGEVTYESASKKCRYMELDDLVSWEMLRSLSLWFPAGEVLSPLISAGLDSCPVLEEISIKVEGDCRARPGPFFGLRYLAGFPVLAKMKLDLSEAVGYALTAPAGQMDLSLWERFYLHGIDSLMTLYELDYWPPQDKEVNQRSLTLPAVGLLQGCVGLRKLFVHGTTHEHFLTFFLKVPNLRDMQLREDYYPAPESDMMNTEMRAESWLRFENQLNIRLIED